MHQDQWNIQEKLCRDSGEQVGVVLSNSQNLRISMPWASALSSDESNQCLCHEQVQQKLQQVQQKLQQVQQKWQLTRGENLNNTESSLLQSFCWRACSLTDENFRYSLCPLTSEILWYSTTQTFWWEFWVRIMLTWFWNFLLLYYTHGRLSLGLTNYFSNENLWCFTTTIWEFLVLTCENFCQADLWGNSALDLAFSQVCVCVCVCVCA